MVDRSHFYVYGSIDVPVHGHPRPFVWGAWAQVDEDTFFLVQDLTETEGRESNAPFHAELGTDIPFYPCTLGLSLQVHIQPKGFRPQFYVEHVNHPLALDHCHGVEPERIEQIRTWFESLKSSSAVA